MCFNQHVDDAVFSGRGLQFSNRIFARHTKMVQNFRMFSNQFLHLNMTSNFKAVNWEQQFKTAQKTYFYELQTCLLNNLKKRKSVSMQQRSTLNYSVICNYTDKSRPHWRFAFYTVKSLRSFFRSEIENVDGEGLIFDNKWVEKSTQKIFNLTGITAK